MHITFDKVTTFKCMEGSIETGKVSLINLVPNLTHLILSYMYAELHSIESKLDKVLNKRIQRLDIDAYSGLKQLTDTNIIYFSNVRYINFHWNDFLKKPEEIANIAMKMMKNFPNLQTLLIYTNQVHIHYTNECLKKLLNRINEHLDMKDIRKNYQMKSF